MDEKVIKFEPNVQTYLKLAERRSEEGDYVAALDYLFDAKAIDKKSIDVLAAIADAYADLDLLELSNQYWFYYLDLAPKDKQSVAFEELAINYFYMNKQWAAGYWFHQKIERDGRINPDTLDPEIAAYFSREGMAKEEYHIAYPFNRADYSPVIKRARAAFADENLNSAVAILEKIPEECRDTDISGELAFYYFCAKMDDKLVDECRASLKRNGDNVAAYCNLVAYYKEQKDDDKAVFYYAKAKSCETDKPSDLLKLATAAMDVGAHTDSERYAHILLSDGHADISLSFMLAIAEINLGKYDEAEKTLDGLMRLNPDDLITLYYSELTKKLKAGDKSAAKLLPLSYVKDFPQKTIDSYLRTSRDYYLGKKLSAERVKIMQELAFYGEYSANPIIVQNSLALYCDKMHGVMLNGGKIKKSDYYMFFNALLKVNIPMEVRGALLHAAIASGVKFRFGVVAGPYYVVIKPAKTPFDNDFSDEGELFRSAYAVAIVKLALTGIEEEGKVAVALSDIYKNHRREIFERKKLGEVELAAIAASSTSIFETLTKKDVCALFGASYEPVIEFMENVMHNTSRKDEAVLEKLLKKFKGIIEHDNDA